MGLDIFFNKTKSTNIDYFRKVNFLVAFFEDWKDIEIQNLQELIINKEDIEELIYRCKEVLNNNKLACELLPTRSGFFFGDTEYDEYYFESIQEVLESMENKILPQFDKLEDNENLTFQIWY